MIQLSKKSNGDKFMADSPLITKSKEFALQIIKVFFGINHQNIRWC